MSMKWYTFLVSPDPFDWWWAIAIISLSHYFFSDPIVCSLFFLKKKSEDLHFSFRGGWIMSYTTWVFGWKASPYVYQTIGMCVTSYMRNLGIRTLQYIDDRMAAESKSDNDPLESSLNGVILPCEAVAYCLVEILTRLGYTLSLKNVI